MNQFPRPRVVVSACLEFEPVRYNGQVMPCPIIRDLQPHADYVTVCPEVEIGLGIPRDPIRIVKNSTGLHLIQPRTGKDVTQKMDAFTDDFLNRLPPIDGFIFKSQSPTIGLHNIKVYAGVEKAPVIDKTSGFFAQKIIDHYGGYPMEEDDRLRNIAIRHHFLTKLFTFARFRQHAQLSREHLRVFHEENRLLFHTYNETQWSRLEEFMKTDIHDTSPHERYLEGLKHLLARPPSVADYLTLAHNIIDTGSAQTTPGQQEACRDAVRHYENNTLCLAGLMQILKTYAGFTGQNHLLQQTLFYPYPDDLLPPIEGDRDKDYWKDRAFTYG
ncbi:MAG: DUF523 and DUF1722 domain-containing protein [Candidatus Thermoplasmatota archaeon]|nr:DUF523 and DUF1722 domain-containing protein [Candidatus Thermoplasmatota archaeon]